MAIDATELTRAVLDNFFWRKAQECLDITQAMVTNGGSADPRPAVTSKASAADPLIVIGVDAARAESKAVICEWSDGLLRAWWEEDDLIPLPKREPPARVVPAFPLTAYAALLR